MKPVTNRELEVLKTAGKILLMIPVLMLALVLEVVGRKDLATELEDWWLHL